jgi:STE24 endopeptidase
MARWRCHRIALPGCIPQDRRLGGRLFRSLFDGLLVRVLRIAASKAKELTFLYSLVFTVLIQNIYPTFIQPLFNKLTPLPEGELRSRVEALAGSLKFPLKHLYVIDGSKRSGHSNA